MIDRKFLRLWGKCALEAFRGCIFPVLCLTGGALGFGLLLGYLLLQCGIPGLISAIVLLIAATVGFFSFMEAKGKYSGN